MPLKNCWTLNEFNKSSKHKINIVKSVAFIYTNDELSKSKVKNEKTKQFHSKYHQELKFLAINLTREVKQ